jgi:hypothetical protein
MTLVIFPEVPGSIYSPSRSVATGGGICRREGAAVAGKEVRPYLQVRPALWSSPPLIERL